MRIARVRVFYLEQVDHEQHVGEAVVSADDRGRNEIRRVVRDARHLRSTTFQVWATRMERQAGLTTLKLYVSLRLKSSGVGITIGTPLGPHPCVR